jgi:hypothetical protein
MLENKPVKNILFLLRKNDRTFERRFYTARHMTEYLQILVEEARRAGFAVPDKPFCSSREQIVRNVVKAGLTGTVYGQVKS